MFKLLFPPSHGGVTPPLRDKVDAEGWRGKATLVPTSPFDPAAITAALAAPPLLFATFSPSPPPPAPILARSAAFSASNSLIRADSVNSCSFFLRRYACAASRFRSSRCLALTATPPCLLPFADAAPETAEGETEDPSEPAVAAPAAVFLFFFFADTAETPEESIVPLRDRCCDTMPSEDADLARGEDEDSTASARSARAERVSEEDRDRRSTGAPLATNTSGRASKLISWINLSNISF